MRMPFRKLLRNARGAAAVEFGLAIPVAIVMLLGTLNMGIYLYFKNSMSSAIDETARSAILYPQPTDAQLTTKFTSIIWTSQQFGNAQLALSRGTSADGRKYVDLVGTGSYDVNLVFVNLGSIPVRSQRRAYFQE